MNEHMPSDMQYKDELRKDNERIEKALEEWQDYNKIATQQIEV